MLPAKWYQTSFLQAYVHGNEDDCGILYKHLKIQLLHIKMLNKTVKMFYNSHLNYEKRTNHNKEINNIFHETTSQ